MKINVTTTTTTIFTLMLLNGLLVLVEPNFRKPTEEMSKEELNVFSEEFLHLCEE